MKSVTIIPWYGWGWYGDGHTMDVPPPFKVRVTLIEESDTKSIFSWIGGRASEPNHILDRMWVLATLRSKLGPDPGYNIFCYDNDPPFANGGKVDLSIVSSKVSGFGTLKLPD